MIDTSCPQPVIDTTYNVLSTMNTTTPEKQPDKEDNSAVLSDFLLIVFIHGCDPHWQET